MVSGPGSKSVSQQPRAVEQVHLADAHHVEHREQALQLDARAGLFVGFAQRAGFGGLAEFHEAGGQRPHP